MLTHIPGNRDGIEDGRRKFLFPISEHRTLARKIVYAIVEFTDWIDFRVKNISTIREKAIWEDDMKAVKGEFCRLVGQDSYLDKKADADASRDC